MNALRCVLNETKSEVLEELTKENKKLKENHKKEQKKLKQMDKEKYNEEFYGLISQE